MPALAKRLDEFQVSASVRMTMMGRELAAKGVKVVSLASGEPDFRRRRTRSRPRTAPRARATPSTRRRTARGR
jgi:hypothetical protein